jgi:tetratricopeptide (TPR) repeat protein
VQKIRCGPGLPKSLQPPKTPLWIEHCHTDNLAVDASRAIDVNPRSAVGHEIRGRIYAFRRDPARAVDDFTAWIESEPKNASADHLRGRVYTDNYDYDRAIADFTKEIEIEPDNADAYRGRSLAYVKKQNPTAGLADYNRGIGAAKRKI